MALVDNKVVRWNGRSFEEMPNLPFTGRTLSQTICFFDRDDRLWISARRFLSYLKNGQWNAVRSLEHGSPDQRILGAGAAAQGGIWFAEDTLLKRFHRGRAVETKPRIEGHQFDEVALWEDDKGNLWETGKRNGLVVHTADGRHLTCTTDNGLSNNVITANTTVEDRERCTEVGMVDFISKPVRRTTLVAVMKNGPKIRFRNLLAD